MRDIEILCPDVKDSIKAEELLSNIEKNIDEIRQKYENMLNPQNNGMTRRFIKKGHDTQTAYAMSFMTTFMIILAMNGIEVIY